MATPTSAIDDLLGLLSPDEAAVVRAVVLKNDKAKQALEEGLTMRKEYLGEPTEGDDAARAAAAAAAKAATDKAEADRLAAVAAAAANGHSSVDLTSIAKQLGDLNNSLTSKLTDLEKKVVTKDELNKKLGDNLGLSIRNAHQAMSIELQHSREFPDEKFDLDKVNEYYNTEVKKGRSFADLQAVYNEMYAEKRVEKKIADGIAEGVRNKKSADGATAAGGGSGTAGISAAQELIRKQRGDAGTSEHVVSFAEKLRKIREAREAREGGADEAAS
jgi:hypothetical protein